MKLHEDLGLYKNAVQFTAQQMQLKPEYVEKDYWVTYALRTIFNHEIGKDTVFKGGTALSKCYNFINRFSEDIDLVVIKHEGESNNKLNSKIRKISEIVSSVLSEEEIQGITNKMGMNRKTAHSYSKAFNGAYGQVRPKIIVEVTWLGYHEPYCTKSINSFVGQMMYENDQHEIAKEYGMLPFELKVLEPTRTICEKIMSLVRFSYGENPLVDLKNKIRHTYDLHQLLQQDELLQFFRSSEFDEMLLKVANDDVLSFKNNNKWLIHHPTDCMIFKELETVWNELKPTYQGDFKALVYSSFPDERAVLSSLKLIQERIRGIIWNITV